MKILQNIRLQIKIVLRRLRIIEHLSLFKHFSYAKYFFANIQKQWNMLKSSLLFKKNTNFMGKLFENFLSLVLTEFTITITTNTQNSDYND